MNKNTIFASIVCLLISFNFLNAGCGSCGPAKKTAAVITLPEDILTSIPETNLLEGKVEASCGSCNFATKESGCSLSIRVGEQVFSVKGTEMKDHGDSHAKDGFCNAIRVAEVKGNINKGTFNSESFALISQE